MIFFCEDCGEKNHLTPAQLQGGKAVFKCTSCGYHNSYKFSTAGNCAPDEVTAFLKEADTSSDIIGSFLFHATTGVLQNNMSHFLKDSDLLVLGKILSDRYLSGLCLYPDVREMALVISNRNMIVKMIDRDLFLILAAKSFPLPQALADQLAGLGAGLTKPQDQEGIAE